MVPGNVNVLFRSGLTYELCGSRGDALNAIGSALEHGYSKEEVSRHPDLAKLRADSRFHESHSQARQ
jgi:hypothetical protein